MKLKNEVLKLEFWLILAVGTCLVGPTPAAEATVVITDPEEAWESISLFFQPPIAYRYDFGLYPSPQRLDNGSLVETPEQWQRQRREILKAWHRIMGPWPPLIEKPELKIVKSEKRDGFTQHWVSVEVDRSVMSDGYLLVPDGPPPFPAVVVVFYEPETAIGLKRDYLAFGLDLARRGYVTLQLNPVKMSDSNRQAAGLQHLSYLAYQAANNYNALANLSYVDPDRIGVMGHSFGGKWAMFAACLYDKFAAGVWVAPGIVFDESEANSNYWTQHYLGADDSAYLKLKREDRGLLELQSLMAPRPFFVSAGSPDHDPALWRALNHLARLNRTLGYENRIGMSNRPPHSPSLSDNEDIYRFFDVFLKNRRADRVEQSTKLFSDVEMNSLVRAVIPEDRMRKYVDRNKDFTDYDLRIAFEVLPWEGGGPEPPATSDLSTELVDLGLYYRVSSLDDGLKMVFTASGRPRSDLPAAGEPRWQLVKIKKGQPELMIDPASNGPARLRSPLRPGRRYWLRLKLTWNHTAVKLWTAGEAEPLAWPLNASDLEYVGGKLILEYFPSRIRYDRVIMNGNVLPLESITPYQME
jgi:dienelactone hydrolase